MPKVAMDVMKRKSFDVDEKVSGCCFERVFQQFAGVAVGFFVAQFYGHPFVGIALRAEFGFLLVFQVVNFWFCFFGACRDEFVKSGYGMAGADFAGVFFVVVEVLGLEHAGSRSRSADNPPPAPD